LRHTFVPRIRYLGFTTRGKKGPLTTTGDLYACESRMNFDTIINRQHRRHRTAHWSGHRAPTCNRSCTHLEPWLLARAVTPEFPSPFRGSNPSNDDGGCGSELDDSEDGGTPTKKSSEAATIARRLVTTARGNTPVRKDAHCLSTRPRSLFVLLFSDVPVDSEAPVVTSSILRICWHSL
jgi:hypothetical protein